MMMLEDLDVRVPNSEGMLGPDDELVGVAGVLIVMDQVCEEGCEHILEFEKVSHIARMKQVVHALK